MKTKFVYALAGVMALGFTTGLKAEDKPEGKPAGHAQHGSFSPEDRSKMAKELGLDPEELQKLPQQERMVKIKEASDKKIAELQKKKSDGTITSEEKETLHRLEMRKQMFQQRGAEMGDNIAKALGLNPEELKNLSPEERRAKIKEAADKKYAELEKKKADGTISDSEKEMLQRMEQRRQGGEGHREHGSHHGDKEKSTEDKK